MPSVEQVLSIGKDLQYDLFVIPGESSLEKDGRRPRHLIGLGLERLIFVKAEGWRYERVINQRYDAASNQGGGCDVWKQEYERGRKDRDSKLRMESEA